MIDKATHQLIAAALTEDIGPGDVTATFFTPAEGTCRAAIIAKADGVAAGTAVAEAVFLAHDPDLLVTVERPDGSALTPRDTLLTIEGNTRSILTAERTALNFLGRLCGIATLTKRYVDAVSGTKAKVLDTRKTTPGWRTIEKAAVLAGGGTNHRMGLYDRVMVKDNHLLAEDSRGALQDAITAVKAAHPGILVELEADTLDQLRMFLTMDGVDIVLLDNMDNALLREAVAINDGTLQLEASGGITLDTIGEVAKTGVDAISSGALTHSAKALDVSLTLL